MPDEKTTRNRSTAKRPTALTDKLLLPVLAVFTGLVVGGLSSSFRTRSIVAWRNFFQSPGTAFRAPGMRSVSLMVHFQGCARKQRIYLLASSDFATGQTRH